MRNGSRAKLNKKGFTISETLVSLLILALVITLTGGGIVVVKNAYERVTMKANAQTLLSTTMTKVSNELRYAEDIDTTAADSGGKVDTPAFTDGRTSYRLTFVNDADKGIVERYTYGTKHEDVQILSSKTMTDGLVPSIKYSYDKEDRLFSATITVSKNSGMVYEQTIKVRPLN
jgi:type II secretory pathway pseudopilin PulG